MIMIPLLAGAGLLALLMAGGAEKGVDPADPEAHEGELTKHGDIAVKPKKKKAAAKKAVKATKKARVKSTRKPKRKTAEEWRDAASEALSSGSRKVVAAVAKEMKKAGLTKEAKSLLVAFDDMRKEAAKARKRREKKAPTQPKTARKKKARPKKAEPKALPAPKAKTKPKAKTTKKVSKEKQYVRDIIAKHSTSARKNVLKLMKHLNANKRYKEDRTTVKSYQSSNKLKADGLYGVGTAKSVWNNYALIPANPYYWSSSRVKADAQVAEYRRWLTKLRGVLVKAGHKSKVAKIDKQLPTIGR